MRKHQAEHCSIGGFLSIFGDAWSLLILREALYGVTRFTEFQRNTGAAKNLLSERLSKLVDQGVFERVEIGTTGSRFAYELTEKGRSLAPLLAAIVLWSNEHIYGQENAPTVIRSKSTGHQVTEFNLTGAHGEIDWHDIEVVAGPGASEAAIKRLGAGAQMPGKSGS
ncbi:MAG: helix-turn-helix transcriptional regulator [Mangrovicoccus sp.]|nr:helix-turn-helix transcriptional regulator [Mangrovicoccus sp.]